MTRYEWYTFSSIRLAFKIGVNDLDVQCHFGHFDSEFYKIWQPYIFMKWFQKWIYKQSMSAKCGDMKNAWQIHNKANLRDLIAATGLVSIAGLQSPIPTWLLKLCLSELLPVITYIVNLSLSTSTVPYELKLALIIPLLKKYCWIPRS